MKRNLIMENKVQIYNNLQKIIINTDITKLSENNKKVFLLLEFNIKRGIKDFDVKEAIDLVEKYKVIKFDKQRNILYFLKENFPNTVKETFDNSYFNNEITHPAVAIGEIDGNVILIHFTTKKIRSIIINVNKRRWIR